MKPKKIMYFLFVSSLAIFIAACSPTAPSQNIELDGTSWTLSLLGQNKPLAETTVSLQFQDGQVSGSASCNRFGGAYTQQGNNIQFGDMMMTLMACEEAVMDQESAFLQMLANVETLARNNGQLILSDSSGNQLVFVQE